MVEQGERREKERKGGRAPIALSYLSPITSPPPEASATSRQYHQSHLDSGVNAHCGAVWGACHILMILKLLFMISDAGKLLQS